MKKILIIVLFIFVLVGCNKKNNFPYTRKDNKIYFGYYPQTLETNNKIIDKLNKKVETLPNESNSYNWIDYNYYIEDKMESYMFYIDIDLDNDSRFDYRGVYFTKYRPHYTHLDGTEQYSIQYQNNYYINNVYWFKYEKIEWNILEENDGKATIISSISIDSMDFYPSHLASQFEHNGSIGKANNYELSNIRKWLNDNFYNTAFNNNEQSIINKSIIKTDDCNDTLDNVFLLSRDEVVSYYESWNDRIVSGTDYAYSQGLNHIANASYWSLRSPYAPYSGYNLLIDLQGAIIHAEVNSTFYGIRPVININL